MLLCSSKRLHTIRLIKGTEVSTSSPLYETQPMSPEVQVKGVKFFMNGLVRLLSLLSPILMHSRSSLFDYVPNCYLCSTCPVSTKYLRNRLHGLNIFGKFKGNPSKKHKKEFYNYVGWFPSALVHRSKLKQGVNWKQCFPFGFCNAAWGRLVICILEVAHYPGIVCIMP